MIARVEAYRVWGCQPGGPWERYHPPHDDLEPALRELERLRASRPDRMYVVLLDGDPAPEGSKNPQECC